MKWKCPPDDCPKCGTTSQSNDNPHPCPKCGYPMLTLEYIPGPGPGDAIFIVAVFVAWCVIMAITVYTKILEFQAYYAR